MGKGNIIIRDQGILRLTRCTFIHQADRIFQYDLNCQGTGRLEVTDSRVEANNQYLWWRALEQGSITLQQAQFAAGFIRLWALGQANITIANCTSPEVYSTENGSVTVIGGSDIYISQWNGSAWSAPVNAGNTINTSADELQPCLTPDGQTMYFTGERSYIRGIYRSTQTAGVWSTPELVIQGAGVGEPSLTADGQYLYFVYVYIDSNSQVYDADIYYLKKN